MKCIVFWEFCPENREKVLAKAKEWEKELKQNPEKYGRIMHLQDGTGIGFGMIGKSKGFNLMKVDKEEQMQNMVLFWTPLMKLTHIPIIQTRVAKRA